MITADRMATVDRNAAALGVSRKQLMESSGGAVARVVRDAVPAEADGSSVAVVCGRGNNGGDGAVAARFLGEFDLTVYLLGRPEAIRTEIAAENWRVLERSAVEAVTVRDSADFELDAPDVVVDAMLGTGVTGALREPEATAAAAINDADATVVAVDVPSGVDADTGTAAGSSVDADAIVTFHDQKPGLADRDDVRVADIGIPDAAERFVGPGDLGRLRRAPDAHKGDHGDVLVIGGGPYTGAPALAARAALRAGCDLARVVCPESAAEAVRGYSENLIVDSVNGARIRPDHVDDLLDAARGRDVVVLGPGLGDADETAAAVGAFLRSFGGRAVVDADALEIVPDVETEATLLCTPHRGEFERLGGDLVGSEATDDAVRDLATELGVTLLVTGPTDVIADGERVRRNRTGDPGMTVGGTGDVLAGACGALFARVDAVDAAAVGAYAAGRAGAAAVGATGNGIVATDLLERLPEGLRDDEF